MVEAITKWAFRYAGLQVYFTLDLINDIIKCDFSRLNYNQKLELFRAWSEAWGQYFEEQEHSKDHDLTHDTVCLYEAIQDISQQIENSLLKEHQGIAE